MTKLQMIGKLDELELLEKDLMRSLTPEEESLVLEKGWKALLEKLEFTDEDYKTFRRIQALISSFCTENEDRFEEEVAKENYAAKFVLQSIVNELQDAEDRAKIKVKIDSKDNLGAHCKVTSKLTLPDTKESEDSFDGHFFEDTSSLGQDLMTLIKNIAPENLTKSYINRLRNGEVLHLSTKEIDEIVDTVWKSKEDCNIRIVNNEIRFV